MIGIGAFAAYYAVEEDLFNYYGAKGSVEFSSAKEARKYIIEIQQTAVKTKNSNPVFAQLLSDYLNGLDTYSMYTSDMFEDAYDKTLSLINDEGIPAPTNLSGWLDFLKSGIQTAEAVEERKQEATISNVIAESFEDTVDDVVEGTKNILDPTKSIVPWLIAGFVFLAIKR